MHLLLLALACDTPDPAPDGADTGTSADTAANDSADTADTAETDTNDTGGTDTGTAGDADADGYLASEDCDDGNPAVHPGAVETCDGVDENCDGSIDEGNASVALFLEGPGDGSIQNGLWYGYDADDHEVLSAGDLDRDGVFNWYTRSGWANGFVVSEERSYDGVTVATLLEYDREVDGTVTEARYDSNGDGTWDYSYGYTYQDGVYTGYWTDSDYDGVHDYAYGWEYDSAGNMTYYWEDSNGDGDYEQEAYYTYDGTHFLSGSTDADGDGVFETSQVNTWVGDRIMEELVTGGSNPWRRSYEHTDGDDYWDSSDFDLGDDGSVDYRYTQTSDPDGRIASQTSDQYADGVGVTSSTYEVEADGTLHNTSYLDGVLVSEYEWVYYESGLLDTMRADTSGDGRWDHVYSYDLFGHLIYLMYDSPSDGVVDYIQEYAYDERGRRLGATTDTLADGTFQYELWPLDGYACGVM